MVEVLLCLYWGSKHTSQVLAVLEMPGHFIYIIYIIIVYKLESFGIYT